MRRVSSGSYGSRGHLRGADAGIRRVSPTFGKAQFLSYSAKAAGDLTIESDAERLVGHVLTLDPRVKRFAPQPFTIDLIDGRILRTREAVSEARAKHKMRAGPKLYTPDFEVEWHGEPRSAVEVKLEGFSGADDYEEKLDAAGQILAANGHGFSRVVVPSNPKHPLRANLPLLTKAALRLDLWPSLDQLAVLESACGDEEVALASLCQLASISPNLVPALLVSGAVRGDLSRHAIRGDMVLASAYGDLGHLELLEGLSQ
jgi:hypothetical protein